MEELISQRLIKKKVESEYPVWVLDSPFKRTGPIRGILEVREADVDATEELEIELITKEQKDLKAKRFVELIKSDMKPSKAARRVGIDMNTIDEKPDLKARLKKLIEEVNFPAEIRKQMVRSSLDKILLENIEDGGIKEQKLALAAAKEIAKDPDVGLNTQQQNPSVVIDMRNLGKLLDNVKPIEGLEDLIEGKVIKEDETRST